MQKRQVLGAECGAERVSEASKSVLIAFVLQIRAVLTIRQQWCSAVATTMRPQRSHEHCVVVSRRRERHCEYVEGQILRSGTDPSARWTWATLGAHE